MALKSFIKFSILVTIFFNFTNGQLFENSDSEEFTESENSTEFKNSTEFENSIEVDDESWTETETEEIEEPERALLYKCHGSTLPPFLHLPPSLRLEYASEKLNYFQEKFQTEILYNFTFIEKTETCQDFTLNISMGRFDPNRNPHFNFTPGGFLGYYKKVAGAVKEIYIDPNNYCVASIDDDSIQVRACKSQCYMEEEEKGSTLCIPRCCFLSQVMGLMNGTYDCSNAFGEDWLPSIHQNLTSHSAHDDLYPNFQLRMYEEHWTCPKERPDVQYHSLKNEKFRILSNGEIYWINDEPKWTQINRLNSSDFCMDGTWHPRENETVYSPEDPSSGIFISSCTKSYVKFNAEWYAQTVSLTSLIAGLIHLVIILVYGSLSLERQQNVYGWSILTFSTVHFLFCAILTGFYGLYGFGNTRDITLAIIGPLQRLCTTIAIVHHFLLIASFSWTTVISFDVWTKIRSISSASTTSKGQKKFLGYSLFGFGVPFVVVLVGIIMEFGVTGDEITRPEYTDIYACFVTYEWSFVYYICTIITPLEIINGVLAYWTVKFIIDSKKNVRSLKDSSTSSKLNKGWLALKLFVLMGVFLTFEVILAFTSPDESPKLHVSLEFYRIFNALGAFWVFVWNDKTRTQLGQKYPILIKFSIVPQPPPTTQFNLTKEHSSKVGSSVYSRSISH